MKVIAAPEDTPWMSRQRVEAALLPEIYDVRLRLDRAAELERRRRMAMR